MKTAYIGIIQTALDRGFVVSVSHYEGWLINRSNCLESILRVILSAEESKVRFFSGDKIMGQLLVSATGFSYQYNKHNLIKASDLYKEMLVK